MSLWTHGLAAAAAVGVAGTGANDSSSSSSSALARSLHQAPHYNLKFKPVSHQFAPEDREYLEALIQMMWPVALVATLLLLRGLIVCLCCRRRRQKKQLITTRPDLFCTKLFNLGLLLATCGAMVLCYVGNGKVTEGANQLRSRTEDAAVEQSVLLDHVSLTAANVSSLLATVTNTSWPPEAQGEVDEIVQQLRTSEAELNNVYDTVDAYDPTFLNDDIRRYNRLRATVTLALTSIFSLVAVLAILAHCSRRIGFISFCIYSCMLSFYLCWMLTSAELPLSVAAGDYCVSADAYAVQHLNDPTATYYIECTANSSSPYFVELQNIESYLQAAADDVGRIENATSQTFPNVTLGIAQLNTSVLLLADELGCEDFHAIYRGAVSALCSHSLLGLVYLLAGHAAAGALLLLAVLLLARIRRNTHPERGFFVSSPEEARHLLFAFENQSYSG